MRHFTEYDCLNMTLPLLLLFFVLIVQLATLLNDLQRRRHWALLVTDAVLTLGELCCLCLLLFSEHTALAARGADPALLGADYRYAALLTPILDPPLLLLYALLLALFGYPVLRYSLQRSLYKPKLGPEAIKESLDELPDGVAFLDSRGRVLLCNRRMHRLAQALLGRDLQNGLALWDALKAPPAEVSRLRSDAMLFGFPDGRIYRFRSSVLADGAYTQLVASDVTELEREREKLERENQELAAFNARAEALYQQLGRIVREEAAFALKLRVHDELGLCLLSARRGLVETLSLEEYHSIGADSQRLVTSLSKEDANADKPSAKEGLDELLRLAAKVGLALTIGGTLPQDEDVSAILLAALRESAVNTLRHTDGGRLFVVIDSAVDRVSLRVHDDGTPPSEPIKEGGGLGGLRRRVEKAGGQMQADASPAFLLTITLPLREEKL